MQALDEGQSLQHDFISKAKEEITDKSHMRKF